MRGILVALVCIASCIRSESVECGFGACPAGASCDETHGRCVSADQLKTCMGAADGTDCTVAITSDGTCDQNVCLPKRCGDNYQRGGEECDGPDLGVRATCAD